MSLEELRDAIDRIAAKIASGPIVPSVTPVDIRTHLAQYDFASPRAIADVSADVERMLGSWHVQVTHPRYLGLFNPSVMPAGVVADTLTAAYNPQLASWRTAPAANEIERHTLRWMAANSKGLRSDGLRGTAIAAAMPAIFGSSISRILAPRRFRAPIPTTSIPCGSATRSISYPTATVR